MKIGSLCTGYGGLDMAVEAYFNAETVWTSDIDKYASIVIDQRIKKPNLGNLKEIDWPNIEPIDILTAGYPCQPFSHAGNRKGAEDERHIWPFIKEAISNLRPRFVILENVRGHLSLGFKEVLKDLAEVGYDARWQIVRASDVGAPHQRARLFVIAYPDGHIGRISSSIKKSTDSNGQGLQGQGNQGHTAAECFTFDAGCQCQPHDGQVSQLRQRFTPRSQMHLQAVPNTLENGRVSAKFVEYMMGLPAGWVTDLEISWTQQIKILGNGVVPQQAHYALELLCQDVACG